MALKKQSFGERLNKFYRSGYLFLAAFALYQICLTITLSAWLVCAGEDSVYALIFKLGRYVAYAVFAVIIVCNLFAKKYTRASFIFFFVAGVVLGVGMLFNKDTMLLLHLFVIVAAYGTDGRRLVKTTLIVQGAMVLGIILLSLVGVAGDYIFEPEGRARHALGFGWATFAPGLFLFLALMYFVWRKNKITWVELLNIEAINVILFILTDTKMSFALLTVIVAIMALEKLLRHRWGWIRPVGRFSALIVVVMCALSILLPLLPEGEFYAGLDKILSGRLELGKRAITEHGFSIFGQPIVLEGWSIANMTPENYNYIDSAYLQLGIKYGVLVLLVVMAIYALGLYKARGKGDGFLFVAFLFIVIYGVTDAILMNFAFQIFPVLVFCDEDPFSHITWRRSKKETKKAVEAPAEGC